MSDITEKTLRSYYVQEYEKEELIALLKTVEVPFCKNIKNQCKKYNIIIKLGKFTRKEYGILDDELNKYLNKNNIDMNDFMKSMLPTDTDRKRVETHIDLKQLRIYLADKFPQRTYKQIGLVLYYRYSIFRENDTFKLDEDKNLLKLVETKGRKWTNMQFDLEKRKQIIQNRYDKLKGYSYKTVSAEFLRKVHSLGLPKTEDEYKQLSEVSKVKVSVLKHKIKLYLKGREFDSMKNTLHDIECLFTFIVFNFYCSLPFNVSKKIEEIKQASFTEEEEIEQFLNNFFDDLNKAKIDLKVQIETSDIFWCNIGIHFGIAGSTARTKYFALKKEFQLKYFSDIWNTARDLTHEYLIEKVLEVTVTEHLEQTNK